MSESIDKLNLPNLLAYARITPRTHQLMQAFWPVVQPHLRDIMNDFYDHVQTDPVMAKMVAGQTDRLKAAQSKHWERLFTQDIDHGYLEAVYRIGLAHVRIDLKPHWYLTGYQILLNHLIRVATQSVAAEILTDTLQALVATVMFDMDMAIWAYLDAIEQEKQQQAEAFAQDRNHIGNALVALAEGDLTYRLNDAVTEELEQIKENFNYVSSRLNDDIRTVMQSASSIRNSATEISSGSDDLARRTETQAAGLEETVAALMQITKNIKESAGSAIEAAKNAAQAKQVAEKGGLVVDQAIATMAEIEKSSRQIAEITSTIDEIAFMTNLLALNAGVEAARAGDAGRGFAVVATEVRSLAGRSRDAALSIKKLITDSSKQITAGVKSVGESGAALKEIIEEVGNINNLVNDIAENARQQSSGVDEVNVALEQMDQVTQQNAAMAEESAAAARNLAQETKSLDGMVHNFRVE